jgi:hypothetical protein
MLGSHAKEYIEQHHPNMPIVQLLSLLNEAQRDFCNKTHIFKTSVIDTSVAGQRYYTLPDNIIKILKVHINDVEIPRLQGDPIIDDDELTGTNPLATPASTSNERLWYESIGRLGVVEKIATKTPSTISRDDKESKYQSISLSDQEIRVFVISAPAELTTANYEASYILSGIQGGYERAILDYVISQGYFLPDKLNPELAQMFEIKYEKMVKEAKKVAKGRYIDVGRIVPNDF